MDRPNPILLAEDSENDAELILAALEEHRLANRVALVRNGTEVLDYLYRRGAYATREDDDPAVVILDIKMPKVSGIEALRLIKDDPALAKIPVVMLTSSREGADVQECYRLGVNAYVVKPLVFQEFFDAVKLVGRFWAVVNERPANGGAGPLANGEQRQPPASHEKGH